MNPALVNWEDYFNQYKILYKDPNDYNYYLNNINSGVIAKNLLEIFMNELIKNTDFSDIDLNNFIVDLPIAGAYDTIIYWDLKNDYSLMALVNKEFEDELIDIRYKIIRLEIQLPIKTISNKVAIPFVNQIFHETNNYCPICFQIDEMYDKAFNEDFPPEVRQEILNLLDNNFLVNGYDLLTVYEKNGYHAAKKAYKLKISKIKEYTSLHGEYTGDPDNAIEKGMFLDKPRLIHSRWCKNCGSRKPDIYDEGREIDE